MDEFCDLCECRITNIDKHYKTKKHEKKVEQFIKSSGGMDKVKSKISPSMLIKLGISK
jgi:hypothetical protein